MDDIEELLMAARGYKLAPKTAEYLARDHTALVFAALKRLGAPEDSWPHWSNRIAAAGRDANPLDIPKGDRINTQQIDSAVSAIANGLRQISGGLHVMHFARATISPQSAKRDASLAAVHSEVLTIISQAIGRTIGADQSFEDQVAAALPDYSQEELIGDGWRDVFAIAAERVDNLHKQFPRAAFQAVKRDRSPWLGRLITELAKIYEEIRGEPARISRPSEKASKGWRCPFAQFVVDLWGYLDPLDSKPPGDDTLARLLVPVQHQ